jgi:meso-butanediol dehydrogenase/(S,S)-butanediol dehydrogenase/diacetyl reductase
MKRFENKVVYVTGAAGGIGQATAVRFASEGASVFITDLNEDGLKGTEKLCKEQGAEVAYQTCDVSNEEQVNGAIQACVERFGKLNVLVNNAGILMIKHLKDTTVDNFHFLININLLGTWMHCKAAMPHLIKSGGNIVNVGSTSALSGNAYQSLYCASKGGISALTRALQVEFASQGVRCNAVLPGNIGTEMMKPNLPEDIDYALLGRRPSMRENGTADETASVIAMLASAEASFIFGEEVRVDGGQLA